MPLGSYVLPSAPASAAAFLTEIGIRPFSQNTYQTQSSSSQTPAPSPRPARCTTDAPSRPEASPGLPTTEDARRANSGRRWARPSLPRPGCPLPARAPQSGKTERSCRVVVVRLLARPGLALRRGPGASAGALPRRRAPSARGGPLRPGSLRLTPPRRPAGRAPRPSRLRRPDDPARRASAARRPERRNRCPAPLVTEPPGSRADSTRPAALNGAFRPKGEAAEGGGREGRRQARGCGGTRSRRSTRGSFRTRAPSSSAPGRRTRHPRRLRPRGRGGPASTGEGVPAPRRSPPTPPAQPPGGDDVTRSRPAARPRPTRRSPPPEPQYLQISPGQRLAPRPSAPSPSRGHGRPAGPPPPPDRVSDRAALTGLPGRRGATTRVAAPSRTTFLCCRSFGGGEGGAGKVGRWARRGSQRPSGAAGSVQAAGSRPALRAAAASHSGLWGPRPRRRLLCSCALSSREPHIPAQEAAPRTRPAPPPPLPRHAPSAPARARRARPLRRPEAEPPGGPRPWAK